jgi:endogenous inhibitor of DNA gyrase (YacG/DUF329 family)
MNEADPRTCPDCGDPVSRCARRCKNCSLKRANETRWARHRARIQFERFLGGETVYFAPPEGMGRRAFGRAVGRAVRRVFG